MRSEAQLTRAALLIAVLGFTGHASASTEYTFEVWGNASSHPTSISFVLENPILTNGRFWFSSDLSGAGLSFDGSKYSAAPSWAASVNGVPADGSASSGGVSVSIRTGNSGEIVDYSLSIGFVRETYFPVTPLTYDPTRMPPPPIANSYRAERVGFGAAQIYGVENPNPWDPFGTDPYFQRADWGFRTDIVNANVQWDGFGWSVETDSSWFESHDVFESYAPADRFWKVTSIPSPVPEAETYAMFLAGLGILGAMARRKKER